jgi:hypothetical protein
VVDSIGLLKPKYWAELNKYKTLFGKRQKGTQDRIEAPNRTFEANISHGPPMRMVGGYLMAWSRQQGINRT